MRPSPDERARKSEEGLKEVRRSRMGARAGAMGRERRMVVAAAGWEETRSRVYAAAAGEGFGRSSSLVYLGHEHDPGRLE
jgi:predicted NAD-dependent protein-ADP-ribosyltransferase YbiA (DUF1768 family)